MQRSAPQLRTKYLNTLKRGMILFDTESHPILDEKLERNDKYFNKYIKGSTPLTNLYFYLQSKQLISDKRPDVIKGGPLWLKYREQFLESGESCCLSTELEEQLKAEITKLNADKFWKIENGKLKRTTLVIYKTRKSSEAKPLTKPELTNYYFQTHLNGAIKFQDKTPYYKLEYLSNPDHKSHYEKYIAGHTPLTALYFYLLNCFNKSQKPATKKFRGARTQWKYYFEDCVAKEEWQPLTSELKKEVETEIEPHKSYWTFTDEGFLIRTALRLKASSTPYRFNSSEKRKKTAEDAQSAPKKQRHASPSLSSYLPSGFTLAASSLSIHTGALSHSSDFLSGFDDERITDRVNTISPPITQDTVTLIPTLSSLSYSATCPSSSSSSPISSLIDSPYLADLSNIASVIDDSNPLQVLDGSSTFLSAIPAILDSNEAAQLPFLLCSDLLADSYKPATDLVSHSPYDLPDAATSSSSFSDAAHPLDSKLGVDAEAITASDAAYDLPDAASSLSSSSAAELSEAVDAEAIPPSDAAYDLPDAATCLSSSSAAELSEAVDAVALPIAPDAAPTVASINPHIISMDFFGQMPASKISSSRISFFSHRMAQSPASPLGTTLSSIETSICENTNEVVEEADYSNFLKF